MHRKLEQLAKGYFSLIQYCPDLGRLEAANVGVLLFCPERRFLQARTARTNARIRRFFGTEGHDWERINAYKQGIVDRLQCENDQIATLNDLQRFIAQRANLIQITAPRPLKVVDPDAELQALFEEFLGDANPRTGKRTLRRLLDAKLKTTRLDRKIRREIRVTVPVLNREIAVPFGYQNGRLHLLQPVPFDSADASRAAKTACRWAVAGRSLYAHVDSRWGELQLVVVGKFRRNDRQAEPLVRRILEENQVKLYRTTDLPSLIEEIRASGKDFETGDAL